MTEAMLPGERPSAVREVSRGIGKYWWLFLITGAAWLVLSLIILRFNTASIVTIGILVGCVIIAAGVNEFIAGGVERSGWRWLHFTLGVLFLIVGVIALFSPADTFWAMAALIGWFLLFKGTFDIVISFMTKNENDLWWLTLVVGILELMLAFWAAGGFGNKVVLLLVWAAAACLARGVTEFVRAFALRKVAKASDQMTRGSMGGAAPTPA
jgi:uncharacterized membrane protein HdeD (DUF308 family)